MIVGNPIIMILKAILNWFRLRRDYIANAVDNDKIPPEIKDALVAWYSPCKQRMTNYDVIESYADNFTKWRIENTGVTSTQKKIVIAAGTELRYNVAYKGFGNSIAEFNIKYTGNAVIRYQYNKEDGTTGIITINRSGIYYLPASIKDQKNFGFYCNPQTVTEETTIEQLPTSILKDFSGNDNHAYLYGGKGKLNSGMGLYKVDFTTYINKNNILDIKPNSFITNAGASYINSYYSQIANNIPTYNIKVANLNGSIKYSYKDTDYTDLSVIIEKDGTYNLPISYKVNENKPTGFSINSSTKVTITQIPDYPDQLCYDGKMYAVAYGLPILTDYTIIADRTWFDKTNQGVFMSKAVPGNDSAFIFEHIQNAIQSVWNYGLQNIMPIKDDGIVYCNKFSYNGDKINIGQAVDSDTLHIGRTRETSNIYFIGCHGNILLFNRTLTDDELDLVKEYFFGIESNIKDALMTTDKKYLALVNNKYIKLNK